MRKTLVVTAVLLTMVWMWPGIAQAQQAASNAQKAPDAKAQQAPAAAAPSPDPFKSEKDKRSYAIGMSVGTGLRQNSIDIDPKVLLQGLTDEVSGGKTLLTDDQVKDTMMALQAELKTKQEAKMKQEGEANKA